MAVTPINSEDRLVQATFAEHLEQVLGWDSVFAWNKETFGRGWHPGPGQYPASGADPRSAGGAGTAEPRPAGLRHQ